MFHIVILLPSLLPWSSHFAYLALSGVVAPLLGVLLCLLGPCFLCCSVRKDGAGAPCGAGSLRSAASAFLGEPCGARRFCSRALPASRCPVSFQDVSPLTRPVAPARPWPPGLGACGAAVPRPCAGSSGPARLGSSLGVRSPSSWQPCAAFVLPGPDV